MAEVSKSIQKLIIILNKTYRLSMMAINVAGKSQLTGKPCFAKVARKFHQRRILVMNIVQVQLQTGPV